MSGRAAPVESLPDLRARVRRDASVVVVLVLVLAGVSVIWDVPQRLSGHSWDGTLRVVTGHLLVVVAGAHVIMMWFGYRRSHDLKRAVRHNAHLALHDPLTGLPNRALFFDRLAQELSRGRRQQQPLGMLLIDLDDFKSVNDRHGHLAGDALLREIGHRLAATARESDTVARIGGDEFLVLIVGAQRHDEVRRATTRLADAFVEPFDLDGQPLPVTASIGLVIADDASVVPDELLRRADVAMYTAKRAGGGIHCFGEETDRPS